jgi:hypothetical protein
MRGDAGPSSHRARQTFLPPALGRRMFEMIRHAGDEDSPPMPKRRRGRGRMHEPQGTRFPPESLRISVTYPCVDIGRATTPSVAGHPSAVIRLPGYVRALSSAARTSISAPSCKANA